MSMKKFRGMRFLMVTMCCFCTTFGFSQVEVLASPQQTIASLFKAMYDGDSTLAKQVFAENASLNSVYSNKEGKTVVKSGKIEDFINAIGSPHDEIWDERISNLVVKEDGDLAQAWMDYSFYIGDQFSHCGVNSMHLVRRKGAWKILQIVDTRRKTDCN